MATIAIIGAGMAGLSALQILAAAGHPVTVFEKSRGSGGRMASKKLQQDSWDMGAQFMRAHSQEFADQLAHWQQQGIVTEWPLQAWQIDQHGQRPSDDNVKRYVASPRMTALSRQLLQPACEFISHCRIIQIEQTAAGQWTLIDEQQQRHGPYDGVVIAVPAAQAIPLLSSAPELQPYCELPMLPCWILLLAFDQPLDTPFDAAFVKQGPLGWIARNNSKPGRDQRESWVIQANHQWSLQRLDSDRHQIQQQLQQAFAELVQPTEPAPAQAWLHRWLYAIPASRSQQGCLINHNGRLAVAGDWLHWPSLEGAWHSGRLAASRLLDTIGVDSND
ncbi:NAD(P)/FAD-dependent oxidoreductase [Oceanobacter mangrovi]|uniref:NAD(P)/FAD-dependent oxidoreductase n=1 Tax=Oceanobacter mangrovi TaxID=2862510 RepID=UPI001C8E23EA|nr:FAD-dependent oxidoreductase [Oceanobacter mangrovi]